MKYRIPILDQVMMTLFRGVPVGKIKKELRKAEIHGLDLNYQILQNHFLAQGQITDLTDSLVYAKENGMTLSTEIAIGGQLMAQYQDKITFVDKLNILNAEGVRDVDAFFAEDSTIPDDNDR